MNDRLMRVKLAASASEIIGELVSAGFLVIKPQKLLL